MKSVQYLANWQVEISAATDNEAANVTMKLNWCVVLIETMDLELTPHRCIAALHCVPALSRMHPNFKHNNVPLDYFHFFTFFIISWSASTNSLHRKRLSVHDNC